MNVNNVRTCLHCNQPNGIGPHELRPYGPNGKDICFKCMKEVPERENEAKRQFDKLLDAAGNDTVLTDLGLKPLAGGKRGQA